MQTPAISGSTRRSFLKELGMWGTASLACSQSAPGHPDRKHHRFELFAEGTVEDFTLIWPAPQLPPLDPGIIVRVRIAYPVGREGVLEWHTFLATDTVPDVPLAIVTFFRMRVDSIGVSRVPSPNFGLFGRIIENPVVDNPNRSPFGDLTGEVSMISGQFDATGNNTRFTLLGGAAAGNHASALGTAFGSLHIRGPWHSF